MDNPLNECFKYLGVTHQVVTFKYNVISEYAANLEEIENWWDDAEKRFYVARNFLAAKYERVLASSVGLHTRGVNAKPHFHFHFIVARQYAVRTASAVSNEKVRWLRDQSSDTERYMREMTVKFSPLDVSMPVWQTLSYPLKERQRGPIEMYIMQRDGGDSIMPVEIIDLLESVGGQLFDVALALQERKQKTEIKKADDLQELYDWAVKNRSSFKTFREMQEYFEDVFLFKKIQADGVHALPEVNNYNRNLKKVGRALGIFRYCDDLSAK